MIIDPTPFTVGRGAFGNGITDWANALIDEVRVSDTALTTEEFLFVTTAGPVEDADFDGDGDVDGADFLTFQRGLGAVGTGTPQTGDADGDTNIDADDLAILREQFGAPAGVSAVPEPSSAVVALAAAVVGAALSRRRNFSNRFQRW
jgi:MYXO-CTERM domain-containing protein